MFDKFCVKIIL